MRLEQRLGATFAQTHPEDAARLLERQPRGVAASFLADLEPEWAAKVVDHMAPFTAAACLGTMANPRAVGIVSQLPVAVAARVLRQLPDPQPLLEALSRPSAEAVVKLLGFPEGTAGAVADPNVITVPDDITVSDAQKQLRQMPERVFRYVYVVDRGTRLVGVLDLGELLAAPGTEVVASVMQREPIRIAARADLMTVGADPAWLDYDALPVVDGSQLFLGVIRHRMLRRLARESASGVSGFTPLVGLAELYWTGFSRMLFGLGEATAGATGPQPEQEAADGT